MRRTTPLEVREEDRALLLSWLGSPRLSARIRTRARIVVASGGGQGVRALARDLGVSLETIYLWRKRYTEHGIDGLRSLSSPGRRSQIDRRRAEVILRAGRARGMQGNGPSVAAVARASGVSRTTVRRLWNHHGLLDGPIDAGARSQHELEIGTSRIVALYIDPPLRVLARVVPVERASAARVARFRRAPRRSERSSAASALLTALEAFGSDTWTRHAPASPGTGRLDDVLARLTAIARGAALEVLAGPGPRKDAIAAPADAQSRRDRAIHLVRVRTHGAWLARATDWLLADSGVPDVSLAGVFGHLMDYFASWRDGSEPFIWTPTVRTA